MILHEATYNTLNLKLVSDIDNVPKTRYDTLYISKSLEVQCGNINCIYCPFEGISRCTTGGISTDQICELFDISPETYPELFI